MERIIGSIIIVALLSYALIEIAKRMSLVKILNLSSDSMTEELIEYLESTPVKILIPEFNRRHFLFNAYVLKGDVKRADETLDTLFTTKHLKYEMRRSLVRDAFDFYIQSNLYAKARDMLDLLAQFEAPEDMAVHQRFYDIFATKSTKYIDEMETAFENADYASKIEYAMLLAKSYESKKDVTKSKGWGKLAEELIATPPLRQLGD